MQFFLEGFRGQRVIANENVRVFNFKFMIFDFKFYLPNTTGEVGDEGVGSVKMRVYIQFKKMKSFGNEFVCPGL